MKRARATPLWTALLLSALAHAITLSGGWLQLPQTRADPPPLMARLELATPAIKPPAPAPVIKRTAKPRATTIAVAPATLRSDAPAPWSLPASEPVAEAEASAPIAQIEPRSPEPEPVVLANAAPSTFAPELAFIKTLPKRGRIAYDLNYYLSDAPTLVGRTVQTWEALDNTYKLDSLSETVGLARLTRFGPRVYHSSGTVSERGLQPERFTAKVVIRGKSDDSAAAFDWSNHALQFGRPTEQQNAALPSGSQDLLSFMYQLSLAPPPRGRLQMPITNGVRFERYEIDVLDEEIITTPLGNLRALPVKQVRRQGRESIEVWLAAEYHYLPVRIRVMNRDGTPGGEQIATEISIGEK
ncbi:MAG TPA: DUF3108 domain-containing protein [Burkholderiales bacterium]|nr:DUF3108 domain-containing protein [Burkholderiales bacterium]